MSGIKVLEYAQFVAGPYCSKLLADLGAEVIKIEPPDSGDPSRKRGPFPEDIPHPEKSALFLYLNTNKSGITLNLESTMGRGIFKSLVKDVDILIEDHSPKAMKDMGLNFDILERINPRLVMTSITPFGQTGPNAEYKCYPLNTFHSGMIGYMTPWVSSWPDREPLKSGGMLGECGCGLSAAIATLAALYAQRITMTGQHVDVSKQEALATLARVNVTQFPNDGAGDTRFANMSALLNDMVICKNGYIVLQINETHHWQGLVQLMGNPEWAQNPIYLDRRERGNRFKTEIQPRIREWAKDYTKEELYHKGQASNCPLAAVSSVEDVLNSAHTMAREFFVEFEHPQAGKVKCPGAPAKFSETPWSIENPAPLLGQHNEQVFCEKLGYSKEDMTELRRAGII
ncbi:MAG: CoA transferase [Chloroflexota bacterium]|nr:CoA transferase [Chloroflexota bacterium]